MIVSLIQDLISGLAYIHHSSIMCHGHMKSSNCLINSCFRLKVTDFGIHRLRGFNPNEALTLVGNIQVLCIINICLGLLSCNLAYVRQVMAGSGTVAEPKLSRILSSRYICFCHNPP